MATNKIENEYDKHLVDGVYEERHLFTQMNHEISVVGYGVTPKGTEYWIGRNSWGTYWGEDGFFKLKVGGDTNLGI